jgi:soluble P-type ATPase
MYHPDAIDYSFLKDKKVLLLSDTGHPYPYILSFLKHLSDSEVYIYICPATTSRFIKLWVKFSLKKNAQIIKDKHYKLFFTDNINKYEVCIIFGKNKNPDRSLLKKVLHNMLISYQSITVITENGVDCDENYTLR